jgi:Tol biopolymer transport system component
MRVPLRQVSIGLAVQGPLLGILACSGEGITTPTDEIASPTTGRDMAETTMATSKIAFVSYRSSPQANFTHVYTMYPDGSGLKRLTGDICAPPEVCSSEKPTWSPSGARIAFRSGSRERKTYDIYVMTRTGVSKKNLTKYPGDDDSPAWAPDGGSIAFSQDDSPDPGGYEVRVVRADGSGVRNLSKDIATDLLPSWSRDGRKIAWQRERETVPPQVAVKNADGTGRTIILPHSSYNGSPSDWSPTAMHVAYQGGDSRFTNIYISTPEGNWWKQLTTKALCPGAVSCRASSPKWSRDGRKIAFVVLNGAQGDIYVMNRDGTGIKRLTTTPGLDYSPTWSPDSRRIAFVSYRDGNAEVYVMNPDGTGQRNLTRNLADDFQPTWSP